MFPVGVVLLSLGYAVAYYGVVVLRWVHDPAHPHKQPPSLTFLLGASSSPGKPFTAPVNTEGASDAFAPFGAAGSGTAAGTGAQSGGPSLPAPGSGYQGPALFGGTSLGPPPLPGGS